MVSSDPILIVEDDPDWQDELCTILGAVGYKCEIAPNFESGLVKLVEHRPMTLVLDLKLRSDLPEDEGFLGWRLARQALELDIPIIIVTGHPSVARARKAFRDYKVIDFFDKLDMDKEELISRVSDGVKASQERTLTPALRQHALEQLRRMFYGGMPIRPNSPKERR